MNDITIGPALEKGVYGTFRQKEMSWRTANIGSKLISLADLQLPTNSILHIADKLLDTVVHTIMPDVNVPFIKNETYPVMLDSVLTIPSETDKGVVFPVTDKFRFRPTMFNTEVRQFFRDHKTILRASSFTNMIHRSNILPVVNYNAMLTATVTGTFVYYRRFDILFRTILNTITQIDNKQQYLQLPLSRTIYSKTQFIQTFDKINYLTVRVKNDPSFYFLVHLINFVSKTATTSLFSQLTQAQLDRLNIVLVAGEQAIIYNLGDLKALVDARSDNNLYQLVLRHINTLKLAGHADMDISTLDEPAYDKLVADVAPDDAAEPAPHESHPEPEAPLVAVGHPKDTLPPAPTATPQPTSAPTHTTPVVVHHDAAAVKPTQAVPIAAPLQRTDAIVVPATVVPVYDPASMISVIDHGAYQVIMNNATLTDAQKTNALKLAQAYKTLLIDGVSIEEHLNQTAEPVVTNNHLGYLAGKIPDASMLDSTAVDMDNHYIQHLMAKDLAAVAASMTMHGMFLIQTEQHDTISQLDRIRFYKLTYEDLTGRRHTVTFKYPIISANGTIMINGIESRMIKQQVNLPICKIDTWRVSLASNYNKTLVERISTRAHNYGAYITKYIAAVAKAKIGLDVSYGNLTTSETLPYDYTSIAKRYSQLNFAGNHFVFDYDARFDQVVGTAYSETKSDFTRNGGLYSLTSLLRETAALPVQQFAVADLKWILQHAGDLDPERVEKADLDTPILVARDADGKLDVINGFHRLTKAVAKGIEFLPGKLVPDDMLQRHRLKDDPGPAEEALTTVERAVLKLQKLEEQYGVYCGTMARNRQVYPVFFGYDNQLRFIGPNRGMTPVVDTITFTQLFFNAFDDKVPPPKQLSEWTELKIQDKNFPIVFILGFEYGLHRVLDHIKLNYAFVPAGTRVKRTASTIVVPFSDGNLVFDRYPLEKSFVASGLLKFDTAPYEFAKFNNADGYYTLLQDNGISMNYLKGISDFFKLFIDPITRDVLLRMHEPTEVGSLLLRATQMLTTDDAIPASSMRNHRLRGYERFNATLYNQMSRSYATFSKQRGNRKVYSINPEAVFLQLISDQTLRIIDEINPIEDIKDKHSATYAGSGGRTAQSFIIEDRRYPEDGIGVLSECTPDNGKVAINTYITANPIIANARGMFDLDNVDQTKLEPSQILSVTSLLMPCATNDDAKRANFINIQLKHHVPSEFSETNRVRTGYELVVAHRTSETFACIAKRDGVIEAIDDNLGLIKVRYTAISYPTLDSVTQAHHLLKDPALRSAFIAAATTALVTKQSVYLAQGDRLKLMGQPAPFKLHARYLFKDTVLQVVDIIPLTDVDTMPMGSYLTPAAKDALRKADHPVVIRFSPVLHNAADDIDIFKFGTKFTSVSGSFLKQTIVVNVHVGDKIHHGDVIAYNSGFFETDPLDPQQVTWKHGVMANIALMECNDTVEDSNAITESFSKRLKMAPAHMRAIQIEANTLIRDIKPIGTEVQTTDLLCTLEDADIASLTDSNNTDMIDLLTELNRKAPRARYHGIVAEMDVLYACPIADMHPTLADVVRKIDARKRALAKATQHTNKAFLYAEPTQVAVGTKYHGVEFEKDTVLLIFYISEEIEHGAGDKLVVGNALKSVTATVIERPIETQSGYPLDMIFSARGISNRITLSPTIVGFTNRCLFKLEELAVKAYFDS